MVGYSSWGRKELDTTEQLHFLSLNYHYLPGTILNTTNFHSLKLYKNLVNTDTIIIFIVQMRKLKNREVE